MYPFHITTATGTAALKQVSATGADFYGLTATNTASGAAFYVKLWWQGAANSAPPAIGTTAPSLTVGVTNSAATTLSLNRPMNAGGPLWVAVTLNGADTDTNGVATGGDTVSLFVE